MLWYSLPMLNCMGSEKLSNTHHCCRVRHARLLPSSSGLHCACHSWVTEVECALALQKSQNRDKSKAGTNPSYLDSRLLFHLNRNSSLHPLLWINALHKKSQSHCSHEYRNVGFSDHIHLQHDPLTAALLAYEKVRCAWGVSAQLATLTSQPWAVLSDYWKDKDSLLPGVNLFSLRTNLQHTKKEEIK